MPEHHLPFPPFPFLRFVPPFVSLPPPFGAPGAAVTAGELAVILRGQSGARWLEDLQIPQA